MQQSHPASVVKEHSRDDDELVSVSKKEDSKETAADAVPIETRLDDTIDEGYLPSAVEGTEEELSEKEDTAMAMKEMDNNNGVQEASSSPIGSSTRDTNKAEDATMPSVLVATATALQQQGQGGQAEAGGIAVLKDEEVYSDESGDMKVVNTPMNDGNDAGEKEMKEKQSNFLTLISVHTSVDSSSTWQCWQLWGSTRAGTTGRFDSISIIQNKMYLLECVLSRDLRRS